MDIDCIAADEAMPQDAAICRRQVSSFCAWMRRSSSNLSSVAVASTRMSRIWQKLFTTFTGKSSQVVATTVRTPIEMAVCVNSFETPSVGN